MEGTWHDVESYQGPPAGRAIVVCSDLVSPWAHVLVHRLRETRRRHGLDENVVLDHRAMPLELLDGRPTPRAMVDREIRACAPLAPEAGWSPAADPWTYPVSTLAGLEAVQAARSQGPALSEELDSALRRAVFADWSCIAVHGVVLEVAATVPGLDVDAMWAEIRTGRPRAEVWHHFKTLSGSHQIGVGSRADSSPLVVLSDGTTLLNPGVQSHLDHQTGEIVIDGDDPSVVEDMVLMTASRVPAE